jgi:hypothetical protein
MVRVLFGEVFGTNFLGSSQVKFGAVAEGDLYQPETRSDTGAGRKVTNA